jgi:hypothetical protein
MASFNVRCQPFIQLFLDEEEAREEAVKPSRLAVSETVPMTFELPASLVRTNSWTDSRCCPNCQAPLDLHQPDEHQPTQLLGTCDDCSRWFFLVEGELDWEGTMLFELPTADMIRATLAPVASV